MFSATLVGRDREWTLPVHSTAPDPDHPLEKAQAALVWYPTCDLTPGTYTLTVKDQRDNVASKTIELKATGAAYIMVIPPAGAPGSVFQVYYCNYKPGATVSIDFYRFIERQGSKDVFHRTASWDVQINAAGWMCHEIPSSAADLVGSYAVVDRDESLDGQRKLWLTASRTANDSGCVRSLGMRNQNREVHR